MLKYWLYIWNSNGISLYRSGTNICDQGIVTLAKWYKLSYWLDLNIDSTSYITPKVSARGFQIEDSSTWLHKEAVTWYLLYKQGHLSLPLSLYLHSSITMSQTALYNESYSPVSCMYQHSLCLPVIKGCGACGQSKAKKKTQVCI